MPATLTTMRCPVCEEQSLHTLTTPFGSWERCANCRGLFIHEDLVASASANPAQCKEALNETKGLLLPTDRACPKCLQTLYDGRIESRGVIFSVCPTCQSLWTSLSVLKQFEEAIEKRIAAEIEVSGVGIEDPETGRIRPSKFYEDSGMASLFRAFARTFDNVADSFRTDPEEKELLKEAKRLKKQKGKKESKPEKIIKAVEPAPPPAVKGVSKPEPSISPVAPPSPVTPMEPDEESPKIEIPKFIFPEGQIAEEKPEALPPEPEKVPEPKPTIAPKEPEPIQYLRPESVKEKPKPIEKKPAISGTGTPKPGFFARLKSAWSPKPRKAAAPKPAPAPKPIPAPKPVKEPPKPKPAPKLAKPAPAPKPKKEKPPQDPFDLVAFWPPWLFAIGGALLSGLRDYGYEAEPAILWALMGWSLGMMVRVKRLYPSKKFQETTLPALLEGKQPAGWRGLPVVVKGQIAPAREEDPKGKVVLKQDSKTVALNKLGRWDVLPRLFGLSNPQQMLKGDVTMKGWYRAGLTPAIEVYEVRAEKAFRRSLARGLRWIFALLVFAASLAIYLSLD